MDDDMGQWVLPKAHFDQGERPEEAAVRDAIVRRALAARPEPPADGFAAARDPAG